MFSMYDFKKDKEKLKEAGINIRPGNKPWMPTRFEFTKDIDWKIKLMLKAILFSHSIWRLPTYFFQMIWHELFLKKTMNKKQTYYLHITSPENINRINQEGIKANSEGYIFVLTDARVVGDVALYQCFLELFALFLIDSKGITGKIIMDEVAEFTKLYQRIIIQDKISKEYIKFQGIYRASVIERND